MDLHRSPRLLLLIGTALVLGGFLATLALSRLAVPPAAPGAAACVADCALRPWLDPEKARRFAAVFQQ